MSPASSKHTLRPMEPQDFENCWAISTLRDRFTTNEVRGLRRAWAYLIPREEMLGVVVEDVSGGSPRVAAFGASVFVTDECMRNLRSCPKPGALTRLLLGAGSSGSPILNRRQIGMYNAQAGLNLVCVHRGEMATGEKEQSGVGCSLEEFFAANSRRFSAIIERLVWAFQEHHRGFHLREILNEAYGPFEVRWCVSGGNWVIRDDFYNHFSHSAERLPPEHEHPYLIGATESETSLNSALWCMFQTSRPVLGFSERQKRVFLQAVRGYSTASIAERLGIGEEAVRNCFRAGYMKLREHSSFNAGIGNEPPARSDKAMLRKRPKFVDLLNRHMEELRPWAETPALSRNPPMTRNPLSAAGSAAAGRRLP